MIDRYQLRYFLAVVETGNFSRAAARSNVAQPTLSVGIAKLEKSLGAPLFLRNSKRVQLTDAGNRLLARARTIEVEFSRMEADLSGLAAPQPIRLGVLATIPTRLIEQIIRRHAAAPDHGPLELVEGVERDLIGRLDRGRIDLALTLIRPGLERFGAEPLMSEGYSLAMPISHRLAHLDSIEPEALAEETMIVRRSCEALAATSRHFLEHNVRPAFSYRGASDDRIVGLVRAGLGITVMPDSYRDPGLARPRLAGFDVRRDIGLLFSERTAGLPELAAPMVAAIRGVIGAEG